MCACAASHSYVTPPFPHASLHFAPPAVLPFLTRQNLFLAPIAGVVLLLALLTLLQVNVARLVLGVFVA